MEAINLARREVWRQQEPSFFEEAVIDADGSLAPTFGECKRGMDISHKVDHTYPTLAVPAPRGIVFRSIKGSLV